jgi:hypothetical protein
MGVARAETVYTGMEDAGLKRGVGVVRAGNAERAELYSKGVRAEDAETVYTGIEDAGLKRGVGVVRAGNAERGA